MTVTKLPTPRTYHVAYKRDLRGTGLDWRCHFYGDGHWVVAEGQPHSFQTEAAAEAAGRDWVETGGRKAARKAAPVKQEAA